MQLLLKHVPIVVDTHRSARYQSMKALQLGSDGTVSALEKSIVIKTKMLIHVIKLVTFQTRFSVFLCCLFHTFGRF